MYSDDDDDDDNDAGRNPVEGGSAALMVAVVVDIGVPVVVEAAVMVRIGGGVDMLRGGVTKDKSGRRRASFVERSHV